MKSSAGLAQQRPAPDNQNQGQNDGKTAEGEEFSAGAFAWLGHGIGGYQGGYFFDQTGSYTISYANAAFAGIINLMLIGALLATLNRRRAALAMAG